MTKYTAYIWTPEGKEEITVNSDNGNLMEVDGICLIIKLGSDRIKYANMPFIVYVEYTPVK